MILILMGVTASGKTTIGQRLAQKLEWIFADADDYHSQGNRDKMAAGIPLTDADRAPWLESLNQLLEDWEDNKINGILACSALKQEYRNRLQQGIEPGLVHFVWLDVPRAVLEEHLAHRSHAFMNPKLLDSQLQTLEAPADALDIHVAGQNGSELSVDDVTNEIVKALNLCPAQP